MSQCLAGRSLVVGPGRSPLGGSVELYPWQWDIKDIDSFQLGWYRPKPGGIRRYVSYMAGRTCLSREACRSTLVLLYRPIVAVEAGP